MREGEGCLNIAPQQGRIRRVVHRPHPPGALLRQPTIQRADPKGGPIADISAGSSNRERFSLNAEPESCETDAYRWSFERSQEGLCLTSEPEPQGSRRRNLYRSASTFTKLYFALN